MWVRRSCSAGCSTGSTVAMSRQEGEERAYDGEVSPLEGYEAVPGADLVEQGLSDLERGIETPPALLVSIAASRLRSLGLDTPRGDEAAGRRLYALLAAEDDATAPSRYNALVGRITSFARAAEHAQSRRSQGGARPRLG